MDKKTKPTRLREQTAPEKNTDKAYVRVSEDGSPEMPKKETGSRQQPPERNTGKPSGR